jgi:hypothetical protein
MALDFPDNPAIYQVFRASNLVTYQWDGEKWNTRMRDCIGGANPGPTPPPNPFNGLLWFNTVNGRLYVWFDDGDSKQWTDISFGLSGGSKVHVDVSPPDSANNGDLWFNTQKGELSVYYNDGDTCQWVNVSFGASSDTSSVHMGTSPLSNPGSGSLWYDTSKGKLCVYYDDGDTKQWVDVDLMYGDT